MFIQDADSIKYKFHIKPFLSKEAYSNLYLPGKVFQKVFWVLIGYLKRTFHVIQSISSDYVLIHREAAPLGPPVFEWILAKIFRKKIIFDFDDAIWLSNTSDQNKLSAGLKWHKKFNSICKWSYKISAGNEFLADKARPFNNNVFVLPTVVDTSNRYLPNNSNSNHELITIGWTGSHSTSAYLDPIVPLLKKLCEEIPFRFLFISNQEPEFTFPGLEFRKWNRETEIEDLNEMDIGIMPLPINDWSRGKCGFKLIQYQSLGIPALSTNIPPNDKIVMHKKSGFLCDTETDWLINLKQLISNKDLRKEFGQKGRENIELNYSKNVYSVQFFNLFS